MTSNTFNPGILKACAWAGPAFVLFFLIGAAPLSEIFAPPYASHHSADQVAGFYNDHLDRIRIGCVVMIFASALFLPFALSIAMYTKRAENGLPILYTIQVASAAITTIVIMFIPMFWGIAAFRPDEAPAYITQTWNDAGWFGVLFTVPPFTLWCVAIGLAILRDQSARPWFPRWTGYLNLWAALLYVPADLMIFWKEGAFSQNGAFVFYLPVIVFFVWICTMSVMTLKAISREQAQLEGVPEDEEPLPEPVAAF